MELRDSLIMLAATAAVSGFLIPFVLKQIDTRRAEREKEREQWRARHDKLVDAQEIFLDRLTEKLWRWRYVSIRVTYYGGTADEQAVQQACDTYRTQFWEVLNEVRVEISRSSRLVSADVLRELKEFYDRIVALDRELLAIAAIKDPVERRITYSDLNRKIFSEISHRIDILLEGVADDLQLSKKSL